MTLLRLLLCLIAGATATAALAPFNIVWLAPAAPLLLYLVLQRAPARQAPLLGWAFGVGFFGSGVSWVFFSISEHSATPLPLAVAMTALFVMALALLFMLQAWLWKRWFSGAEAALAFIGLWVLGEWLRSWLLTGFPWLYLGYAATDTPLAAWAPIGGVWLNSLIFAASGILLVELFRPQNLSQRAIKLTLLALPWALLPLIDNDWTQSGDKPVSVTLVQADTLQEEKWDPKYRETIFARYEALTLPHSGDELIIWPETAISTFFSRAAPYLGDLLDKLDADGSALISGLPTHRMDPISRERKYHNSLAFITGGSGVYHKQRLVPFGEYVPLEDHLRGVLDFFNLPMSSFSLPLGEQRPLLMNGMRIAAAICYEIAYPELVRQGSMESDFIVTVSNDTWFGHSIAPDQHMQIAQMRALETGRWVIRATNNGISGFIDPQGQIRSQAPRYTQATVTSEIETRTGLTPFQQFGSTPVLGLAALFALAGLVGGKRNRRFSGSALDTHQAPRQ